MILYFLHIPKTAGTSVTQFLDRFFEPSRILRPQTWNQYYDQAPVEVGSTELVRGHFGLGAKYLFDEPLTTMTLLRDPVERTLSQYNHLRIDRKYNNWAPEHIPLPPLAQALDHPFWRSFFSNPQTRYLGLDLDPIPHLRPGFLMDSWEAFLRPRASIEEIHAAARRHLLEFACVGSQERLDETILHLCAQLGREWTRPQQAMVLPGRQRKEELDASVVRKIRTLNAADQELHALAERILESRLEQLQGRALLPDVTAGRGIRR